MQCKNCGAIQVDEMFYCVDSQVSCKTCLQIFQVGVFTTPTINGSIPKKTIRSIFIETVETVSINAQNSLYEGQLLQMLHSCKEKALLQAQSKAIVCEGNALVDVSLKLEYIPALNCCLCTLSGTVVNVVNFKNEKLVVVELAAPEKKSEEKEEKPLDEEDLSQIENSLDVIDNLEDSEDIDIDVNNMLKEIPPEPEVIIAESIVVLPDKSLIVVPKKRSKKSRLVDKVGRKKSIAKGKEKTNPESKKDIKSKKSKYPDVGGDSQMGRFTKQVSNSKNKKR